AAIALQNTWGTPQARYGRILELSQYLWQQLIAIPQIDCLRTAPPESGLVSFQVKMGTEPIAKIHDRLVKTLEKQGLMLRTILSPSCVRACIHYFTLETELDQLVAAIKDFVS
ncbi:MAG: cysteine lyase, partial [Cyanothece sp. SIO1E1]|nr:cysteine lyase [Cyanothece sp. SIO1E1]